MNDNLKNLVTLSINSFIAYIFSYLVILIPSQIITLIAAKSFSIPVSFNYFKIAFQAADYSNLWTQSTVIGIYISAPAFVLITGLFFRYFKSFLETNNYSINLFLIWGYAHCMNIFFGGLIIGIPLVKGFGYVPIWLYFPNFILIIIIIISIFLLFLNASYLKKVFVALSFSDYYLKNPSSLLALKILVIFLPCVLANSFFYFIKFPDDSLYEKLLLVTMFIQLIDIIPYNYLLPEIKDENKKVHFSKKTLLWLIAVVLIITIWRISYS